MTKLNKNTKNVEEVNTEEVNDLFASYDETINEDDIVSFDTKETLNGAHEITIKQAGVGVTNSGAGYVDLKINIKGQEKDGEPKEYNIARMYLYAGDAKGNKKTFQGKMFDSAFKLLGINAKVGKAMGFTFEDGMYVEKKIRQFTSLLNKKIGAVIQMKMVFKRRLYDVQNGVDVEFANAEYGNPYQVWIDNYEKDPQPEFTIRHFYSLDKKTLGYTFKEIKEKVDTPEIIKKENDRLKKYDTGAVVKTDEQMLEYITKEVKRSCKTFKVEFSKDNINYIGKPEKLDEVPF